MGFGVMFHHFHSQDHGERPGSISAEEFEDLIDYLRENFSILNPEDFLDRLEKGKLENSDIVLSFDDSLLSQFDIALPVLEHFSIKGIFNIYSSVFTGSPDPLELFALFRATEFEEFDSFWLRFLEVSALVTPGARIKLDENFPEEWLQDFPFYSRNERRFRFMRDRILSREEYHKLMFELIKNTQSFNQELVVKHVWMDEDHIRKIVLNGHTVGLHSHTHPTQIGELPKSEQEAEYTVNKKWIEEHLGLVPEWVAHPCGNYSEITLDILGKLGIRAGFRSSLTSRHFGSPLEIPREDHSNLISQLKGP